ncbi:MAG: zinc metalloprotease HtpX [Planctomycetes bacterium]|nr:zinc metalloprotease HtpX [Planctomycetota bacterium]
MNSLKTAFLMTGLMALLWGMGMLFGGPQMAVVMLCVGLAINFFSFWFSDKIVLAMHGAREVAPRQEPEVYAIVQRLAGRAGIPTPRVYIIPDSSPNAFATGRNPSHAAVAFTDGILNLLDENEVEGVTAHELAHIKNRDILIGTLAAAFAGAIMMIASIQRWSLFWGGMGRDNNRRGGNPLTLVLALIAMIVAPLAAMLIQMAISRSREYLADETGARIAGSPDGLASALARLREGVTRRPFQHAHPATAHMYIVAPLSGDSLFSLFSTHPPLEERIRRLRGLRGTLPA